jgi:hypothetical protein
VSSAMRSYASLRQVGRESPDLADVTLPGPSRRIIVVPIEVPAKPHPKREPERDPDPAPEREPAPPADPPKRKPEPVP